MALAWLLWCTLHSLLICRWWTSRMRAMLGQGFAWYRLFFNVFSLVTLLPVVFCQFSLKQVILFEAPLWWTVLQAILCLYPLYMFYVGSKRHDLTSFLGLKQVRDHFAGRPQQASTFAPDFRGGVRHPWYSAGFVLVWIFGPMTDVTLAAKIILSGYFVVGAYLEGRKLLVEFGKPYAEYCRKVPMLIPRFRMKK